MSLKSSLRESAKRSKTILVAYGIYDNWLNKRRFKSGNKVSIQGSTHAEKELADSLAYINTQFNDYLLYAGMSQEDLRGKRILEVGFGDNVGVALKFISAGATAVTCIDKFYSERDQSKESRIYTALRETLDETAKSRFDQAISLTGELRISEEKIKCIYGAGVDDSDELRRMPPFDLVISRAVMQAIYDPDATFAGMDRVLAPGGYMLHKIDLSDMGVFRDQGLNPLTYLTIPESVYRLMADGSGRSNRKLINYYRDKLKQLGYEGKLLITEFLGRSKNDNPAPDLVELNAGHLVAGVNLVDEIRGRLIPQFRSLPDQDLIISGIFLVARKPVVN